MDQIKKQIEASIEVKRIILGDDKLQDQIRVAASLCINSLKNGNKIIFAGNGGSAADSQHLAAELVNRFGMERPGIAALALSTDTSIITSVSNDYGFSRVFSRQIEAIGKKGDVLILLSTSGTSLNILEALATAEEKGISTIGLTGESGGQMVESCNILIRVPSSVTPRIQESHILIGHILCSLIETGLYGS